MGEFSHFYFQVFVIHSLLAHLNILRGGDESKVGKGNIAIVTPESREVVVNLLNLCGGAIRFTTANVKGIKL